MEAWYLQIPVLQESDRFGMKTTGKNEQPDGDLDKRLAALEQKLHGRRKADREAEKPSVDRKGYGNAFRLSSEFIAAILVGTAIGYAIDVAMGTLPWAMMVFLLLGFAAGVLNVLRVSGELSDPRKENAAYPPGKTDAEDGAKGQYDEDDD